MRINVALMNNIIDNQRTILLSVKGTNIWSGQQPQQYNSQAIAWGTLRNYFSHCSFLPIHNFPLLISHELFAIGKRYQFVAWVTLFEALRPEALANDIAGIVFRPARERPR